MRSELLMKMDNYVRALVIVIHISLLNSPSNPGNKILIMIIPFFIDNKNEVLRG